MYTPKDQNERIMHRLKIAKGHLEKVIKMTEDKEYCIDIIHQSKAVQSALNDVDDLIMENHLKTCAAKAIRRGDGDEAIAEIMNVLKKKNG